MKRRAVITGIGVVASNGIGKTAFWESILACRSGIAPITLFDATGYPCPLAGEVKAFRLEDYIQNGVKARRLARHTQLALAAVRLALDDAGLSRDQIEKRTPIPVILSVSTSSVAIIAETAQVVLKRGPGHVSSSGISSCQPQSVAATMAAYLGVPVSTTTLASSCTGGLDALAQAGAAIRNGSANLAIAGAADSPIDPFTMAALSAAGMVPTSNGFAPGAMSRPFDRLRSGGLAAEGSGILIIEELGHALARGAHIGAEIAGWNGNMDIAGEAPSSGLERTMAASLVAAGVPTKDMDYLCAAGPSDPILDRVESDAIKRVFGPRAYRMPVSSIKGVTGNPLSAGGPLQVAAAALAMTHGRIPPTANYENPDPACDLDYVPLKPRRARIRTALVNAHGLGGSNYSLVLRDALA